MQIKKIDKTRLKGIRLRFLSFSVIFTLIALVTLRVLLYLNDESIIEVPAYITSKVNSITLVIGTLFVISLVLRLTIKRIFNIFEEPEEKLFYSKIYSWTLYIIGLIVILNHFGVSLGNITIFLGLIATGLAFAIRDVLLSFFGWIILLRKKPFRIGDYIRLGENEGRVIHIGTFYVLLDKTPDLLDDFTRVPNRLFLEKSIEVLGKENFQESLILQLKSIPDNRVELNRELINELAKSLEKKENITINIDIRNEKMALVVKYIASIKDSQSKKSEVIDIVFQYYKEYLVL